MPIQPSDTPSERESIIVDAGGGLRPYTEDGEFTHEGQRYPLDAAFQLTRGIQPQSIPVDQLRWVLEHDHAIDPQRLAQADPTAPVLTMQTEDGRQAVVDGLHRLQKAVDTGLVELPGYDVSYLKQAKWAFTSFGLPSDGSMAIAPGAAPATTPATAPALPPLGAPAPPAPPVTMRNVDDAGAMRTGLYDSVLQAAQSFQPIVGPSHTLALADVGYKDDEPAPDSKAEKEALLRRQSVARRLYGTWQLRDNASGEVIDQKRGVVANVPHIFDSGSFIRRGTRYVMGYQQRLRPGAYIRRRKNGEAEAHFNTKSGTGPAHRYVLQPETGNFFIQLQHARIPLVPLLESLGAERKDIEAAWGKELTDLNYAKKDGKALPKLYDRLLKKAEKDKFDLNDPERMREKIRTAVERMELDPEVTKRTIGRATDRVDADAILRATKRVLDMERGDDEADDRDHPAFATFHGPEHLFAERIKNDYGRMQKELLRKAARKGSLRGLPSGALDKQIEAAVYRSGLASSIEEVNPLEVLDRFTRVTRYGEGGLPSTTATPAEARDVNLGELGFIDSVKTAESLHVGVDNHFARQAKIGSDNKLYAPFLNRQGETEYLSPDKAMDMVVAIGRSAIPGYNTVVRDGQLDLLKEGQEDYRIPNFEDTFGHASGTVPMKSAAFPQRTSMAARMGAQALPLSIPEAPLVRTGVPGKPDESYDQQLGERLGAIRAKQPGRVLNVSSDYIEVAYPGGKTDKISLSNYMPTARKTFRHNTPVVQPGDTFEPGQLLARSNFTDEQGVAALGKNLRIAFTPVGDNWEDAYAISESAANKMRVQQAYKHRLERNEGNEIGKKQFVSVFGSRFKRDQLDKLDDDGVARVGQLIRRGDPLVLALRPKTTAGGRVHRQGKMNFGDASLTWDHNHDGIVTDVVSDDKGVSVVVATEKPMEDGDKLCYDANTEILTEQGWKSVADVSREDRVCCLEGEQIVYRHPTAVHRYAKGGDMYRLETQQIDLLVTKNHSLYIKRRGVAKQFELASPESVFGKRVRHCKSGTWLGRSPQEVVFPPLVVKAGQSGNGERTIPELRMPVRTYLTLLGAYLADGHLIDSPTSGSYGIAISKIKQPHRDKLLNELDRLGVKYTPAAGSIHINIYSKQLMEHFRRFGKAPQKHIPQEVFGWAAEDLKILFEWLMWGDGHVKKLPIAYTTVSRQLADDMQRLCLHIGKAANIQSRPPGECVIKGKRYKTQARYDVRIINSKLCPTVNHSHVGEQSAQIEEFVEGYDQPVYCVTVPQHVVYVRRNGKTVWCGNSGRYGNKGVVVVMPDAEMPHDADGNPIDVAVSPLSVISRGNPAFPLEAILGKVAAKRGRPYSVEDFSGDDLREFIKGEMRKEGVPDKETLTDPRTGRKIPGVLVGNSYMMALHHQAESKGSSRGLGLYSADDSPAKGEGQAKRVSMQEANALLAHGAYEFYRESGLLRGRRNDDYWEAFMNGNQIAIPQVPAQYRGFVDRLRAAGINPVRKGPKTRLLAMTDKDVDTLSSGRNVTSGETVDLHKNNKPIPGGLFDERIFGGDGNQFAAYQLAQPLPNPIFEDPLRRLLGLTGKEFRDVLAGRKPLGDYGSGPEGLKKRLEALDVDAEIERARSEIRGTKKTARDAAVRRLGYLKSMKSTGMRPADMLLSKIPVLPPALRPIIQLEGKGGAIVNDANYLYRELISADENLRELKKATGDTGDEQLAVYDAYNALVGLADPQQPELKQRGIKGILKKLLSKSPKSSVMQRKLLSGTVDTVGRGVIAPMSDLDMDQVGIPENLAFEIYEPYVHRKLRTSGMPTESVREALEQRSGAAREALLAAMQERPVVISRAPVLHKLGILSLEPQLIKGDVIRLNPFVYTGYNADNDGDAMNFHVPHAPEVVKEVRERMTPSRMLISSQDYTRPNFTAGQDYLYGLAEASGEAKADGRVHYFEDTAAMRRALARGEIDYNDRVRIADQPQRMG